MITVNYTRTNSLNGSLYRVVATVTSVSGGISTQVFVFATSDGTYNRIGNVDDVLSLQTSQNAALTAGDPYYRLATVTRDFTVLANAQAFSDAIPIEMQQLVNDFHTVESSFIGVDIHTTTSNN